MKLPWWQFATSCAISFILGVFASKTNFWLEDAFSVLDRQRQQQRRTKLTTYYYDDDDVDAPPSPPSYEAEFESQTMDVKLLWELNMRRARPYGGITVPEYNGYSAKCIPDATLEEMNAKIKRQKLQRHNMGLMDGRRHENGPSENQVGPFIFANMKYADDRRPIWTREIWEHIQSGLDNGTEVGPTNYRDSSSSVLKAVTWTLENRLQSCGAGGSSCRMSVFSAISPWAEGILFWTASKLRRQARITNVEFNPCVLDGIPPEALEECVSTPSLVTRSDTAFDLTVSYSGIEHDGLGRYGDPINPTGDISAMREMWLATRPGGVLLLAVPCAGNNTQPQTSIPVWGNRMIQVLQHRAYGAERYMRLLVGWELEGFVLRGQDVVEAEKSKLLTIVKMIQCSYVQGERQPLLILRKMDDVTFDDVLVESDWSSDKTRFYEEEYLKVVGRAASICRGEAMAVQSKYFSSSERYQLD